MVDVDKQVAYWRDGASEDMAVARELLASGRSRHAMFFAHLALEKALKAHVVRQTQNAPPRIHNLPRLVQLSGLEMTPDQARLLADMNVFCMVARYPDQECPVPEPGEIGQYLSRAAELVQWSMSQL